MRICLLVAHSVFVLCLHVFNALKYQCHTFEYVDIGVD